MKLTLKQEKFCQEYIKNGGNASAAYRAAYNVDTAKESTVNVNASKLLNNTKISLRIEELKKQLNKKYEADRDRVIKELVRLAHFDPRNLFDENNRLKKISEMDADTAAAIAGLEVSNTVVKRGKKTRAFETTSKIKLIDKNSSLEKLCKHLGLYEKDNQQKEIKIVAMGNVVVGGKPLELKIGEKPDESDGTA